MKALIILPLRVSPLIKLSRWIFLISGIYYGVVKHKKYSIAAANFRAEEESMASIRAAQFAREQAIIKQETAKSLVEALTGLRVRFEKGAFVFEDDDLTTMEESTSIDNDNITSNDNSLMIDESNSKDDSTSNKDVK